MQILSKINTLCKGDLVCRFICHRHGFGVHSPYVFNLITKIIEEKYQYYSYYDIELIRKELLFREEKISYNDLKLGTQRSQSISEIVKQKAIHPKHGALLFRLTNYFKSKNILQLGTTTGLSSLYLSSYSKGLHCVSIGNIPEFSPIAQIAFEKGGRNPIDLRAGTYQEQLPKALNDLGSLDFVYFNTAEERNNRWLFNECLKKAHDDTVFVFEGIRENQAMVDLWKEVCDCPEVTVSLDLYSMGIVLFKKRLHKRNYIVYF